MDSYASVPYADEYLGSLIGTSVWKDIDSQDKERALVTATLHIDALSSYGGGFRGKKTAPDQPLIFPRCPDTEVPENIKRACCHEALALLEQSSDPEASKRTGAIRQGITAITIGDVSESYAKSSEAANGLKGYLLSDMAISLISPYMAVKGVYPII